MTARVSVWRPFVPTAPTHSTGQPMDAIRFNLLALAASNACAAAIGWSYTNSVTRSEASPGTPMLPNRKYWKSGSGNSTIWIKAEMTYDITGFPTTAAFYYSDDNEATYVKAVDGSAAQNYVLNMTYDGSGNLTETTWSNA